MSAVPELRQPQQPQPLQQLQQLQQLQPSRLPRQRAGALQAMPAGAARTRAVPAPVAGLPDHVLLVTAIAERLHAGLGLTELPEQGLRGLVQDCAHALHQLRPGLAQAHGERARIEQELQDVRAALARARHELAGTRDGERRALHLAEHDGLTALPNRGCFQARLDAALARRSTDAHATLAVLFLDLDNFKPINDQHGHQTGDELLRIVAQRLSRAVRGGDMVCRLGGDEFACLLATPMGREQLEQVAAKLFDAISAPLSVGPLELSVRPSIGIAVSPSDGSTTALLLRHADTAMYRAKKRQLGYTFFDGRVDA